MKKIWISVFTIFLVAFISCEKNDKDIDITTGLTGNVKYGIGDCMPSIDESSRIYNGYNGSITFFVKSELESLGSGDYYELKKNSINHIVKNGELRIELPVNTYLVIPSDVVQENFRYGGYTEVIIREGVVLEKDFKFWKCTSY